MKIIVEKDRTAGILRIEGWCCLPMEIALKELSICLGSRHDEYDSKEKEGCHIMWLRHKDVSIEDDDDIHRDKYAFETCFRYIDFCPFCGRKITVVEQN